MLQQLGPDAERARYAQALLKSCHAGPAAMLSSRWGLQHPLLERLRLLKSETPSGWARRLRLPLMAGLGIGAAWLVQAAAPELPRLQASPLATASTTDQGLSRPPAGDKVGMLLEFRGETSAGDTRRLTKMWDAWPEGAIRSMVGTTPRGDWCLEQMLYVFADGQVRAQIAMLDADCKKPLSPLALLKPGGEATQLQHDAVAGGRPIAVSMRWLEPQSAEMARMREYRTSAPLPEELRAIDEAWQRARAASAPSASAQPNASSAASEAPAASKRAARIRLALDIDFEQRGADWKRSAQSKPVLVVKEGSPGSIHLDMGEPGSAEAADGEKLMVWLSARDLGEGRLQIDSELRLMKSGELLAKPRLIVKDGERARIETGREGGPGHLIRLDLVASVLPRDAAAAR